MLSTQEVAALEPRSEVEIHQRFGNGIRLRFRAVVEWIEDRGDHLRIAYATSQSFGELRFAKLPRFRTVTTGIDLIRAPKPKARPPYRIYRPGSIGTCQHIMYAGTPRERYCMHMAPPKMEFCWQHDPGRRTAQSDEFDARDRGLPWSGAALR